MSPADTKWLDDAPDAQWLDEAPDAEPAARPAAAGMGDLREAERRAKVGTGNVPIGLLTGDPETDARISANLAEQGQRKELEPSDALHAGAIAAGLGLGASAALPAVIASGALLGGGMSQADDAAGMAGDAAKGAAGALAGHGVLRVAGKSVGLLRDWLSQRLGKTAIEQGRKALSGIGTPLSARKPIPEAAVREALESGAIRPLGTVKGTAERLGQRAETLGEEYGAILSELEAQGVTGPNAVLLARKIADRAKEAARTSLGSPRPGMLEAMAEELPGKVDARPFASKRLGLGQAEEMKRGLQNEAKREYDKITRQTTTAGETKKELAAMVREAIEESVEEQASKAPAAAAAFRPVKARLSNTLEAQKAAEEGAARAARRKSGPGLTSTIAGAAAGAASGSAPLGLGTAIAHGLIDSRLASTLASSAYHGAGLLNASPATAGVLESLSGPERLAFADWLRRRLDLRALTPATAEEEP